VAQAKLRTDPAEDSERVAVVDDPAEHRLRADARRNRRSILEAARARFAEQGLDAQMDDIARDAGVGVGTVYRHFPTKDSLLEALAVEKIRRLTAWAHEALAAEDPGSALGVFLRRAGELQATDRMLSEVLSTGPAPPGQRGSVVETLTATVDELVRRGQQAGTIRPDVRGVDVAGLMCGLGRAISSYEDLRWERYVDIVIAGLRADPALGAPRSTSGTDSTSPPDSRLDPGTSTRAVGGAPRRARASHRVARRS
jgi:AcrR family transcriptional regulator